MAIIGIIGTSASAAGEAAIASLDDLRDRAALNEEEFWAIVGISETPAECLGDVMQWLIDNEVAYDLVVHPSMVEGLEEEITGPADKTFKIKAVETKVLDRLVEHGGTVLLCLIGEDEPNNEITAVITKAAESGVTVFDEALTEIVFEGEGEEEEEGGDEAAAEDEYDFEALGASGDEGDADAIATLTELAEANELNPDEYATWTELAEALHELALAEPEPEAAPEEEPVEGAWTQEALDAIKSLADLRTIAKQAGIDGAAKMSRPALVEALLGTAAPAADEAPEPEEEQPVVKKGGKIITDTPVNTVEKAYIEFGVALANLIRAVAGK